MKKPHYDGYLIVPATSLLILMLLSFVNWSSLTDNRITDFSLFEDLKKEETVVKGNEIIDPELEAALEEIVGDKELPEVYIEGSNTVDSSEVYVQDISTVSHMAYPPQRVDGVLPIEDYSPDGNGLKHLRAALAQRMSRVVRIAVIGDSYIEGDIFTQDVRSMLQEHYGGNGVGYMSMHSEFPGFRRSVTQADYGWKVKDIRYSKDRIKTLPGEYCIGEIGATASYRGSKIAHADAWTSSKLLFIAPSGGTIKMKVADGIHEFEAGASDMVQCMTVDAGTSELKITSGIDSLMALGVWLDGKVGISVDCMSLRGNSGASHRMLSVEFANEMSQYINYDMIVVEYGMNAVSSEQTEYSSYGILMKRVIERLRLCYPNADILLLGVGDRGQKSGSEVVSMPTLDAMTLAQRNCAKDCGVLFWDIRQAMGGANSIVDWRERGLVNADYIHLNHKGGGVLAQEFVNSLIHKLDETP